MRQKVDMTEEGACKHRSRAWRDVTTHQRELTTAAGERS